ncbi:hypothetical protein DIZ27_43140 [Streptomyces sp. NWU339]|uniref:hypothetical protein n=1 Tax=Streptomyces sp. NWU339 TaxID=2185284 RepID=UPI000D6785BC|nr:hypothetical protein [Streptomyces sp. NWU339]PWI04800.1 hypothetical protein DIZ27_43140 [Streptomyces sp. NWU339]
MAVTLSPLATGTKVCAIGTDWEAEVVTSELAPARFHKGHLRKSVLRWTVDVPAAGIRKGEEHVWVQIPGRTPRFIVTADN